MSRPREKVNDQWTVYDPPWIEEVPGEPARYWVDSGDSSRRYLVDLTERDGLGACTCEFYQFTAYPNYRRHGRHIPYEPKRIGVSDCKHLCAAKEHWYQYVTVPMLASIRDGIPSTK